MLGKKAKGGAKYAPEAAARNKRAADASDAELRAAAEVLADLDASPAPPPKKSFCEVSSNARRTGRALHTYLNYSFEGALRPRAVITRKRLCYMQKYRGVDPALHFVAFQANLFRLHLRGKKLP